MSMLGGNRRGPIIHRACSRDTARQFQPRPVGGSDATHSRGRGCRQPEADEGRSDPAGVSGEASTDRNPGEGGGAEGGGDEGGGAEGE